MIVRLWSLRYACIYQISNQASMARSSEGGNDGHKEDSSMKPLERKPYKIG